MRRAASFEEHCRWIGQAGDAFARGQLAIAVLLFDFCSASASAQAVLQPVEFLDLFPHA